MSRELKLEDLQSFEDSAYAYPSSESKPEKRRSPRSAFQTDGRLVLNGAVLDIRTVDISARGLSIHSPQQVGVGMEADLRFLLPVADSSSTVYARIRIVYCFHSGDGHYKAGLEILHFIAGKEVLDAFLPTLA